MDLTRALPTPFSIRGLSPALRQNLLLLLLSTLCSFLLLDGAMRWLDPFRLRDHPRRYVEFPQTYRYVPNRHIVNPGDLGMISGHPDPDDPAVIEFYTDRYGFPNRVSDPLSVDLIALADSYGRPVDGWTTQLGDRTQASVYNLSMAGASPWQEYAALSLELPRLRVHPGTRIVWLLFAGNDVTDPAVPNYHPAAAPPSWPASILMQLEQYQRFSPWAQLFQRLRNQDQDRSEAYTAAELDDHTVLFYRLYQHPRDYSWNPNAIRAEANYPALLETIEATQRLADDYQLDLSIFVAPSKEMVYEWLWRGQEPWSTPVAPSGLALALQQDGIPVVDLTPGMIADSRQEYEETGRLWYWRDDTHWGPAGHAYAAQQMAEEIARTSSNAETKP